MIPMNQQENSNKRKGTLNRDWGAFAEDRAAEYLRKQGYTILERNLKFNKIEIDIVAQKNQEIVFVEVKARSGDYQDPVEAVDRKKRAKIPAGADIYLRRLDQLYQYRFDIITLTGNQQDFTLEHYEDAFMPTLKSGGHRFG